MKILKARDKFLSNYEVECHLNGLKEKYNWTFDGDKNDGKNSKKRFSACGVDLEVITRDTLQYLKDSPSSHITSDENFKVLMTFLNQFELVKVEKLQIVNSLPRSMVALYALVEECDQRLDEEKCNSIIDKINELFPIEEEEEEEEEEQEEEEKQEDE